MGAEKTPVTILNEMMIKIRSTVVYEPCTLDTKSTPPIFTCKVICDGVIAVGSGRSKKEAKQNAAQIILDKINKQTVILQPSVTCKPPLLLTDVTIKELQKLCSKYDFEEPIFKELDTTGPPHAPNFNMQCTVSTLTEVATAKTKKQAKFDAANKMIKRLQDTFLDHLLNKGSTKSLNNIHSNGDSSNNISKSTYKKSTEEFAKLKINYGFKMGERKKLMNNSQDLAPALLTKVERLQNLVKECQENINENTVKKVKCEFQNMLESVNIDFHHMLLQTVDPTTYMLIIQLNTLPDILEMSLGATREEAELRTMNKIIESLSILMK